MTYPEENSVALARSEAYRRDLGARLKLVSLTAMTPARVRWLVGDRDPQEVVHQLVRRRSVVRPEEAPNGTESLIAAWASELAKTTSDGLIEAQLEAGAGFLTPLDTRWPFGEDPDPPLMVFVRGNVLLLERPNAVAVVGTRRCTSVGRRTAHSFGEQFAHSGVNVVSGLALGVDGSAHRGTIDEGGGAIAVVGSGVDVVYPKANTSLWEEVAANGLLISEYLCGTLPAKWRFPARNRLIAALSDGVVVVESHERGGSLLTAEQAAERGKPVFAVPGSVLSAAADGTNALLMDGAIPARNAFDVMSYLGHLEIGDDDWSVEDRAVVSPLEDDTDWVSQLVLSEAAQGPVHLDTLALTAGTRIDQMLVSVQRLADAGLVSLFGSTVSLV